MPPRVDMYDYAILQPFVVGVPIQNVWRVKRYRPLTYREQNVALFLRTVLRNPSGEVSASHRYLEIASPAPSWS